MNGLLERGIDQTLSRTPRIKLLACRICAPPGKGRGLEALTPPGHGLYSQLLTLQLRRGNVDRGDHLSKSGQVHHVQPRHFRKSYSLVARQRSSLLRTLKELPCRPDLHHSLCRIYTVRRSEDNLIYSSTFGPA